MRKIIRLTLLVSVFCTLFSCSEESLDVNEVNQQTILVYMPWSGSDHNNGLYSYFLHNLDSIKAGIVKKNGLDHSRLMVFLSTSATTSRLYEITYLGGGKFEEKTIKDYTGYTQTTAEGITNIINTTKNYAQGLNYAMIIGCHGCGWTYKEDWEDYPNRAKKFVSEPSSASVQEEPTPFAQDELPIQTRFFGSVTDMKYSINIEDLSQGIQDAGVKMQYILFDDCYMANIETAYELRNVTNFLVGSTSEVIVIGMPYYSMWSSLSSASPSYSSMVNTFHSFYSNYTAAPYGALSAIDCRKLDDLAATMREINNRYTIADSLRDSVQVLDGFRPHIFYDYGSYVNRLCENQTLLKKFNSQLAQTVVAAKSTDKLFTALYNQQRPFAVAEYSGVTCSDLSTNSVALKGMKRTSWWTATH